VGSFLHPWSLEDQDKLQCEMGPRKLGQTVMRHLERIYLVRGGTLIDQLDC